MAGLAPAVAKLMQDAVETLPVVVFGRGVVSRPGFHLFNQRQALGLVFGRFGLDLFQPGLDHLVGLIAGLVEALPQRMVGHTALVRLLPLVAQGTQAVLHLATTHSLAFRTLEQPFRLGHEFFTQLISTPALPTLQLSRSSQCGVRLVFQFVINQAAKFLERIAQGCGGAGTGLAMTFSNFKLQF